MTESEFEPQSVDEVAADLTLATNGPLAAFYKDPRKEHAENTPALTRLIQHLRPDIWEEDPNWALQTAVRQALKFLPDGGPEHSKIMWQEIGEFLCGFRVADIPRKKNGERPGHKDYAAEVKARTGITDDVMSDRSFRDNVTAAFRLHLASSLLSLEPETRDERSSADNRLVYSASYIPRPALESQARDLYAQGRKLIALVGQPGMGKTALAREVARQLVNTDVPLIQITERGIHTPDLAVALRTHQIDHASANDPIDRLAALISDEHSPPLVILDNLDSADKLRSLLPSRLRSTVLATARVKSAAPPENAVFVSVDKMAQSEAEALVRRYAPSLDVATVERLARELHGYPLVLRHAGVLLERGGLTVGDLASSLRSTTAMATTVGRMRTEDGARLAVVLNRVVELIREEDELACELLCLVAFVRYYTSVSHQFLFAYAQEIEQGYTRLRTRQAVETLTDFALIDQTERDVRIHPLTRTLLAGLFVEGYDQVYALALKLRAKQKERCTENEAKYHMPRVNPFVLMDNGLYAYHEIDARREARYWAERERRNESPEPNEVPDWARVWDAVASRRVFGEIREQAGLPPLD